MRKKQGEEQPTQKKVVGYPPRSISGKGLDLPVWVLTINILPNTVSTYVGFSYPPPGLHFMMHFNRVRGIVPHIVMKGGMRAMIRTFYYFLKAQKYELLTCVFAIVSIISINYLMLSYIWAIFIVFFSTSTIIYLRQRDKSFYYISLKQRRQKDEWFGSGEFAYYRVSDCFLIANSESGYIYSRCLEWSDYTFSCKFKVIKHCLGIIIRAVNLSNYVMLQIDLRSNGISPHIRINSGWKRWAAKECGLEFTREQELSLDKWYQCHISCVNESINIKLTSEDGRETILNRVWNIPRGSLIFSFPVEKEVKPTLNIPFAINLEYGSIGFRNDLDEKALVKEVLISKI